MQACPQDFLDLALELADKARGIIRPYYRQAVSVERKSDATPVTAADRGIEEALRAQILTQFPEHGVVGEELGAHQAEADYLWVLDPIDGTKRFVAGSPQFGCLIALMEKGHPLLGIIDMPILEERWIGARGRATTFLWRGGTKDSRTAKGRTLSQAVISASSPQMFPGDDFAAFERVRAAANYPLYGCDCFAYGLLANGGLDLVIESTMAFYDFAALIPVVEGAGGVITDWAGTPLGKESDGRILAAGDRALHEAARALLDAR
jgi:inositol-phosphate phosphatase/L-galactose 1-phosphate phosphatase/histidinol-phosphatase